MTMSDETPQNKVKPPRERPAWRKRNTWQQSLALVTMTIGLGAATMPLMYISWWFYLLALAAAMMISVTITWRSTQPWDGARIRVGGFVVVNIVLLLVLGGVRLHTNYMESRTIDVAVCDSRDVASSDGDHADTQISTDQGKYILEAGVYGNTYRKKPNYDYGQTLKGNRLRLTYHGGSWFGGPYVTGVQYIGKVVCD